jgi:hypothetical protein
MILELPLVSDQPHFDFEYVLDGVNYVFEFRWNDRAGEWFFDVRLEDGTDVLSGLKVVLDFPLGARSRHASRPPGMLIAFDSSGKQAEAGLEDLGSRVRILYFDKSEINAVRSSLGLPTG